MSSERARAYCVQVFFDDAAYWVMQPGAASRAAVQDGIPLTRDLAHAIRYATYDDAWRVVEQFGEQHIVKVVRVSRASRRVALHVVVTTASSNDELIQVVRDRLDGLDVMEVELTSATCVPSKPYTNGAERELGG